MHGQQNIKIAYEFWFLIPLFAERPNVNINVVEQARTKFPKI